MRFWSVSTTIRSPERIRSFLKVLKELEGEIWNTKTQGHYQVLLLQRKVVGFGSPEFEKNLSRKHLSWLNNDNFTYKQAEEISKFKKYVGGLEMRGRQSFNPIEKMGLAYLDAEKKIIITSFGNSFLEENYDLGNFFFRSFLKWQYPNPDLNKYSAKEGYNIKPLIATFHLLNKVNSLCLTKGIKVKGVSKIEFAMFFTTLSNYKNIDTTAEKLIEFRNAYDDKPSKSEKDKYAQKYFKEHFSEYGSWKNANEYADNVIRYFRLTRFIYMRGNENYIDLEPRRKIEIDTLLNSDNASAKEFSTKEEYTAYLGNASQPELPWETKEKLQEVIKLLLNDIEETERNLVQKNIKLPKKPKINVDSESIKTLNNTIDSLRAYRRNLSDTSIHADLQLYENIENCINELKNIHSLVDNKPVELERRITKGLHALNDALEIFPNYPVGDDNEPIFTAPANKPDIECYYKTFNSICEVTLLTNRSQWFNEGQPVMRHFRDFELVHGDKQSYCIFVAPKIHRDTANTFWISVKYEYEGKKQKIIPITIQQFIDILQYLLEAKKQNQNYFLSHIKIQQLFEDIVSITENVSKSDDWLGVIPKVINKWGKSFVA